MTRTNSFIVSVILSIAITGCVTNYQYISPGTIKSIDNAETSAVLFWRMDSGRLWYGKKYTQWNSDVTLRVCGQIPRQFSLNQNRQLVLEAESGDIVSEVQDAVHAIAGNTMKVCGHLQLNDSLTQPSEPTVGSKPTVAIFCKNTKSPYKYPLVGAYQFNGISRAKIKTESAAPDPCYTQAP